MCVLIIKQRDKIESKNSAQLAKTHPDAIYNLWNKIYSSSFFGGKRCTDIPFTSIYNNSS